VNASVNASVNTASTTVDPLEGSSVATLERPCEVIGADDLLEEDLLEDELLVEEISIDGMCGVY
jgi:mycofactocin precursor